MCVNRMYCYVCKSSGWSSSDTIIVPIKQFCKGWVTHPWSAVGIHDQTSTFDGIQEPTISEDQEGCRGDVEGVLDDADDVEYHGYEKMYCVKGLLREQYNDEMMLKMQDL